MKMAWPCITFFTKNLGILPTDDVIEGQAIHIQILITSGTRQRQCTKEYYTKHSWRTLPDVCMVSEVLRVVPCCQVLL